MIGGIKLLCSGKIVGETDRSPHSQILVNCPVEVGVIRKRRIVRIVFHFKQGIVGSVGKSATWCTYRNTEGCIVGLKYFYNNPGRIIRLEERKLACIFAVTPPG